MTYKSLKWFIYDKFGNVIQWTGSIADAIHNVILKNIRILLGFPFKISLSFFIESQIDTFNVFVTWWNLNSKNQFFNNEALLTKFTDDWIKI